MLVQYLHTLAIVSLDIFLRQMMSVLQIIPQLLCKKGFLKPEPKLHCHAVHAAELQRK